MSFLPCWNSASAAAFSWAVASARAGRVTPSAPTTKHTAVPMHRAALGPAGTLLIPRAIIELRLSFMRPLASRSAPSVRKSSRWQRYGFGGPAHEQLGHPRAELPGLVVAPA